MLFRRQQKEYIVTIANNLALVGLFLLAIAMTGAHRADQRLPLRLGDHGIVTAIVMAAAFIGFWYAGPVLRRANLPPR